MPDGEELRYMALLHDVTGVSAKDCIIDEEDSTIIFIVPPGQAGIAVGSKGRNVRRISKILGRRIEIVVSLRSTTVPFIIAELEIIMPMV